MRYKNISISWIQLFALCCYYGIFRYFPVSTFPVLGRVSKYLRYTCCKHIFLHCGKNVNVERLAFFASGRAVRIGDNSGLGINCRIPSDTIIGENVMMGPNCYIFQSNHIFVRQDIPIIKQGFTPPQQTVIEDDVWIGRNVTILPGKIIKKGIVIGTECCVTKNFDEYSVIGGNPARLLKTRGL